MNQDLNNLNQNNFNTQGNNGVPSNQPLNNNIDNQSTAQSARYYQNNTVQEQKLQQLKYQQHTSQTIQNNSSNQNFQSNTKKKKTGLIIGIVFATIFIIGVFIVAFVFGFFFIFNKKVSHGNNIFYGKGYQLNYGSDWEEATLKAVSGYDTALSYRGKESYLLPLGTTSLDETINCDFELSSCKNNTYNEVYLVWNSKLANSNLYLYKDDSSFKYLIDDIYYVTYNYGFSPNNLKGKYYLLISKEKNAVISFMTNTSLSNVDELDNAALKLFKNITIDKIESTNDNIIYDDELYDTLLDMYK